MFDPTVVGTIFTDYVEKIGEILTDNIPLVVAILAALVGFAMVIRYFRRWVGRK